MLQRGSTYNSKVQQAKEDFLECKSNRELCYRWKNTFFTWYFRAAVVLGGLSVAVCVWRNGMSMMLTWIVANIFAFGLMGCLINLLFPILIVPALFLRMGYFMAKNFISGVKSGAEG